MKVEIIRTDNKNLIITVRDAETLEVRAPKNLSKEAIEGFVREKRRWIEKKAKEKQKDSGNIRSYRNPFCFLFIHLFFVSAPYQIVNTYVIIICQSDQHFDRNVT